LNDSIFSKGQAVLLLITTFGDANVDVRFSKLVCSHEETGNVINPKIIRIESYYLLEYQPSDAGRYAIRGFGEVMLGHFSMDFRIKNQFTVR
jgi:hypothetical protein